MVYPIDTVWPTYVVGQKVIMTNCGVSHECVITAIRVNHGVKYPGQPQQYPMVMRLATGEKFYAGLEELTAI